VVKRTEKRPLVVQAQPLPRQLCDVFGRARALVRFFDLESKTRPNPTLLQKSFGLTAAEARMARHISSGESLDAAADELAISYETARKHLRAIFAKTDTHRQAELVALLGKLANGQPSGSS
jgi:DNA-binding CsgD family transcriptional regulator